MIADCYVIPIGSFMLGWKHHRGKCREHFSGFFLSCLCSILTVEDISKQVKASVALPWGTYRRLLKKKMSRKPFVLSLGEKRKNLVNAMMMQGGLDLLKSVVGTCFMQLHPRSVLSLISD